MDCFMGVDIGTSGCRAVLLCEDLTLVDTIKREWNIDCPQPGYAEQDPEAAVQSVTSAIDECISVHNSRVHVLSMGMAAAICSLICLDAEYQPLTKAWTWADLRSRRQAEYLKATYAAEFYRGTGCPFHPMYWPAKILFIKENLPEIYKRTRYFVSLKDYILFRMTGGHISDLSLASATGLLNIHTLSWDHDMLKVLGIGPEMLWEPVEPAVVLQHDKNGTAIIAGASDAAMSNVGCGALHPGAMALMVGSTGALRVATPRPLQSGDLSTWCYYIGDRLWLTGGATNDGGSVLKWFRDRIFDGDLNYEVMSAMAKEVPPGSRGLLFLPFLAGERCPHWRADARAVFHGLTLSHTKAEMVRAMMEGVAFQMYNVFSFLGNLVCHPYQIRVTGGIVHSPVWLSIFADLFGRPLSIPQNGESSAVGTAILGMKACGIRPSLRDISDIIEIKNTVEPDAERNKAYQALYQQYCELYNRLVRDSD